MPTICHMYKFTSLRTLREKCFICTIDSTLKNCLKIHINHANFLTKCTFPKMTTSYNKRNSRAMLSNMITTSLRSTEYLKRG